MRVVVISMHVGLGLVVLVNPAVGTLPPSGGLPARVFVYIDRGAIAGVHGRLGSYCIDSGGRGPTGAIRRKTWVVRRLPAPHGAVSWLGTVAPRRRSQPIRIQRSSSSRSTNPASSSRPAATRSSPRLPMPANRDPAMTPAHSVRMSSPPCAISRRWSISGCKFGPSRGEQRLAAQCCAEDLILRGHASVSPTPPTARGLADCSSDAGGLFDGLPAYLREGGPARGKGG
jgi:hypothetical protein